MWHPNSCCTCRNAAPCHVLERQLFYETYIKSYHLHTRTSTCHIYKERSFSKNIQQRTNCTLSIMLQKFRQMPRTDSSRNCSRTEQILRQKRVNCHHYCSCHMHHVSEIYTYTNLFPRNQIADALLNIACSRGSGVSVRLTLDRTNVFCESAAAVKCHSTCTCNMARVVCEYDNQSGCSNLQRHVYMYRMS